MGRRRNETAIDRVELPETFRALMRWEDLVVVDPRSLDDNPHNWKTHPKSQLNAALAGIQACGWVLPILFNLTTQRLIDGHGRKAKAIAEGLTAVPVARGRWTEEEEYLLLQSLDSVGSMYSIREDRLASLNQLVTKGRDALQGLTVDSRKTLDDMLSRTSTLIRLINEGEVDKVPLPLSQMPLMKEDRVPRHNDPLDDIIDKNLPDNPDTVESVAVDDVFFSGDEWGLPVLDGSLLLQEEFAPQRTFDRSPDVVGRNVYFCQSCRPYRQRLKDPEDLSSPLKHKGGVLGFFTEDHYFPGLYENMAINIDAILEEKWDGILAPDYSTYTEFPLPLRLYNLYKSRWVACYFQSRGIPIVPILQDVTIGGKNIATYSLLETLGTGIPIVACQCRTITKAGGSFADFGEWLSEQIEILRPKITVIYGGEENQGKFLGFLPKQNSKRRYILLPSFMERRRRLSNFRRSKGK